MTGRTILEHCFLAIGVFSLAIFAGDVVLQLAAPTEALREFDQARAPAGAGGPGAEARLALDEPGDLRLWPKNRVRAYQASLPAMKNMPIEAEHFAKVNMRFPVYSGPDELALDRGAGRIAGTA